jgi:hypothetical protein
VPTLNENRLPTLRVIPLLSSSTLDPIAPAATTTARARTLPVSSPRR